MRKLGLCGVAVVSIGLFAGLAFRYLESERSTRLAQGHPARPIEPTVANESEASPSVPVVMLIPSSAAAQPKPLAPIATSSDVEPIPDVVLADRRAAIAERWGLTQDETLAFDSATEAPSQERMEVMLRHAQGKIAESDLSTELQAADERGLQRVHSILGDERFNEYLSIRWRLEPGEPEAIATSAM